MILSHKFPKEAQALFFLSTGRTGTALIAKVFENSDSVVATHEPFPRLFGERSELYQAQNHLDYKWEKILRKSRAAQVREAFREGKYYVESSAFLSFFAPLLSKLLPQSKFIYIHRHPAEVIRSGMRRGWYESHVNDEWRLRPRPDDELSQNWSSMSQFEKICWYWSAYNEECLRCCEQLPPERLYKVPFRKLVANIDEAVSILSFAGVSNVTVEQVSETLAVKENRQVDQHFPLFEEWSTDQRATLARIAGTTARKLGYADAV